MAPSVSLMGQTIEVKALIFHELPNLWTAIALRKTCREMNGIYLRYETSIRNKCRDKIVAVVHDYYQFLATLYINRSIIRHPPTDGWPKIPLEKSNRRDKDFVVDVARHLPYIQGKSHFDDEICALHSYKIEYNCIPIDYSSGFHRCDNNDCLKSTLQDYAVGSAAEHCIELARNCLRDGHYLYLDTIKGVIIDNVIEGGSDRTTICKEIAAFFEERKESFRALTHVVAGDYNVYEVEQEEPSEFQRFHPEEPIDLNPHPFHMFDLEPYKSLLGQRERFPAKLDLPWVRRLYRKFGWPGPDYQKAEALKATKKYYEQRLDSCSSAPMCFKAKFPDA